MRRLIGLGSLVLLFAGCSSNYLPAYFKSGSAQTKPEEQREGAKTYAQSRDELWKKVDSGDEYYTTDAPHNQVYHFDFDKSRVKSKYGKSIEAQADYLTQHNQARIRLEGHTDERGSREYNIALGMRRAKAVARLLKQQGVPSKQMTVVSYGQEKPVALGHKDEAYWKNRRVQLIFTQL